MFQIKSVKVRPEIVNINSNEPPFYLYSVKINAVLVVTKMWGPDIVKNLNIRVFNLMSRTTEARHVELHENL